MFETINQFWFPYSSKHLLGLYLEFFGSKHLLKEGIWSTRTYESL